MPQKDRTKEFFIVKDIDEVLSYNRFFSITSEEYISINDCYERIIAEDITSEEDIPDFNRSTVDGFALKASSTFGASESNASYIKVIGNVEMGKPSNLVIGQGESTKIPTGGMLPSGADSVIMVEYTEPVDEFFIEAYKSVAPGQNMIAIGEDLKKGEIILPKGKKIGVQEIGVLAAIGKTSIKVHKKPLIGIISTGDEIVPQGIKPQFGQVRDINTSTLSAMVKEAGCLTISFGVLKDNFDILFDTALKAIESCDMVLLSGGSSVGTRDLTMDVLSALPESKILVHGISISPGKPTILASVKNKALWGLPGHAVSAMVVFEIIVKPFIEYISGILPQFVEKTIFPAYITRNIASTQGRCDFIRVKIIKQDGDLWVEPVLGKSGLINTIAKADGLIKIDKNTEGIEKGSKVLVYPF
ncbi:MAG: molybdopterin molybdotransferase MoeA [Desulfobacterales bacterium]|nr:molybdopterin molybdotransferase MoeA [Desulfobacterales bacterium]